MQTNILTRKIRNKGASSAVEFFKGIARAALLVIVLGGVVPARILTDFGYDADFLVALSAGFVVAVSLKLAMFIVGYILSFLAERSFTATVVLSSEVNSLRRVFVGCMVSLLLMVLFAAMGVGVGFLHAAFAYVIPVWAWHYILTKAQSEA